MKLFIRAALSLFIISHFSCTAIADQKDGASFKAWADINWGNMNEGEIIKLVDLFHSHFSDPSIVGPIFGSVEADEKFVDPLWSIAINKPKSAALKKVQVTYVKDPKSLVRVLNLSFKHPFNVSLNALQKSLGPYEDVQQINYYFFQTRDQEEITLVLSTHSSSSTGDQKSINNITIRR